MSDDQRKEPYEVGYGKPPKATRFQKGRSGNPAGRPKSRGAVPINLDDILDAPVQVTRNGAPQTVSPTEVALTSQLEKAVKGDLSSMDHLLATFLKHGAIDLWSEEESGAVFLPKSMPFAMGLVLFDLYGPPPWSRRQVDEGRATYLASRTEEQRLEDERIGYEDRDD